MTPDASAIVAAFAPWHPRHDAASRALADVDVLVAHGELEAYSVLTRLPAPFRAPREVVAEFLQRAFTGPRLALSANARRRLIRRLADLEIDGGRSYDALIALTAAEHDHALVTCDQRAVVTYQRAGVELELV